MTLAPDRPPAPPEHSPAPLVPARAGVPVRVSLLALATGGFGIGTTEFVTMGVLPSIAADLGVTIPEGGHFVSAYALGVVVGAPLLAVLGARVGRTAMLLALMAAFTLGNLASALAPTAGTLLVARFASGLPHGAYFGIASVVAASLLPPGRRGQGVAAVILGLTVANVVGVPLATSLGQAFGWRAPYWAVTAIGALTVAAIWRLVPPVAADDGASARSELGALTRLQVWLALLTGAVGFAGFFAVYSYITPTLTEVSGFPLAGVPLVLALFGVGMTLGTLVGGRLADRSIPLTLVLGLASTGLVMAAFSVTSRSPLPAAVTVFLIGATGSATIPALQTRLMVEAGRAQSLAASLNHSALNLGNALGAWLGGLVIAAGLGYTSPALVGAALAGAGLAVVAVALGLERRGRVAAGPESARPQTG